MFQYDQNSVEYNRLNWSFWCVCVCRVPSNNEFKRITCSPFFSLIHSSLLANIAKRQYQYKAGRRFCRPRLWYRYKCVVLLRMVGYLSLGMCPLSHYFGVVSQQHTNCKAKNTDHSVVLLCILPTIRHQLICTLTYTHTHIKLTIHSSSIMLTAGSETIYRQ